MAAIKRQRYEIFTRQQLVKDELDTIVAETGTCDVEPEQSLSGVLQILQNERCIEWMSEGTYRVKYRST